MDNYMAYWLATCEISSFSIEGVLAVINKFGSLENAWNAKESDLVRAQDGSMLTRNIAKVRSSLDTSQYISIVEQARKESVSILPIIGQNYPKQLMKCQKPPKTIFVRGNTEVLKKKGIAIVGTRDPSEYGRQKSRTIARDLAQSGYSIISGLALGVDTMAHIGALEGLGSTVAVLASGVLNVTPKSNQSLAEDILERDGALVSEYGIDTPAARFKFVQRNRIIAGLSEASIIIEGDKHSGTRHMAEYAKKIGRRIFALKPRYPESHRAELPMLLNSQGSELIETAEQVIDQLSIPKMEPKLEQTTLG